MLLSEPSKIIESLPLSHTPPPTASYDLILYQEDIFLQPQPVPAELLSGGEPARIVSPTSYCPSLSELSRKIQSMLPFQSPPAEPLELS